MSARDALALFEALLQSPEDERDALLAARTAGRPELRVEVEELLQADRESSDFPGVAVPETLFDELGLRETPLAIGTQVGSFRIERLIGSGGMGRVHLAQQENPSRQVALKTLRRGLESDDAFRRFQTEAELLGRLRHPGIAQVYEAGVQRIDDGGDGRDVPYIAMELLEDARPIVEYADDEQLDLDARIALMIDVARAVLHAHQKGVIHRDLKPGNVLVDRDGRVRVIDFGIARAAELDMKRADDARTKAGELLGTPAYMSPEQLSLASEELDTRVDVYALGAILYELVCGRAPFDAASVPLAVLARKIVEEGPVAPRSLVPELPRDVEAILLAVLARDRDERTASAGAFADDLGRYLRDETVEARRPTLLHQVRLFSRRHRLFTAALAIASVALLAATAISVRFGIEAQRANREQEEARNEADAYLQNALDTNFALVFEFARGLAGLEGSTEMRAQLLRTTMEQLAELDDEARRDPHNQAQLARAYVQLGDALGAIDKPNVGDLEGATEAYARAVELSADLEDQGFNFRRGWIEIEEALGDQARLAAKFDDALIHYERALELSKEELAAHPDDVALRANVSRRMRDLGSTHGSLQHHERALELFEEALGALEDELAQNPDDVGLRFDRVNLLALTGSATCNAISPEASLPVFREALASTEDLLVDVPDHRAAAGVLVGFRHPFTEALIRATHFEEAIEEAEHGLFLVDELLARDPRDLQLLRRRGLLLYNCGWAYQERGDIARAAGAVWAETQDDYESARASLEACHELFATLRDEGRLVAFELGFFDTIEGRLDGLAAVPR